MSESPTPGVRIEDLRVTLSGHTILHGVDVLAAPGAITGIIGPNGSGKSTLLRVVYRHLAPTAGRVLIGPQDIGTLSAPAAARLVAAVPQERGSEFDVTVREVVALGRIPHQGRFGGESAADGEAVARALADVNMTDCASRTFSSLSGGERQRVLLARCFAQGGRVLVLDEPTNHLDISHQAQILGLLGQRGLTTLITLHDLNAAAAICDVLHVLRDGAIVGSGPPAEVLTEELLRDVFGVTAVILEHPLTGKPLIAFDHCDGPR